MTVTRSIAGTGLFALDIIVRMDGTTAAPSLGGSAGNVLSILGALGWTAAPVGVLGADSAGRTIRRDFESVKADMRLLRQSEARRTPVIYQHQLDRSSAGCDATHRFTFACPHCGERRRPSWHDDPDVSEVRAELPLANAFYLDRPTRLGVALAEQYASRGAVVVFEPSAVGDDPEMFAQALRASHIIKYADERLGELSSFDLRADAVEVQTRGAEGLRFRSAAFEPDWTYLPAFRLPFLHDTAGAGDWCTAGMLFDLIGTRQSNAWFEKASIARALAFGQVLSTLNCMTEGARGLLAAWSPEHILRTAQAVVDERFALGDAADRTFQSLAYEVHEASWGASLRSDGFGCCSEF